jgi:type VI secretion system secreted protein VgrG
MPLGQEERASIEVGGTQLEVVALTGEEGISRLFRFDVICAAPRAEDIGALIAKPAAISLRDGFGAERRVTGLVAEASMRVSDEGTMELKLVVRPDAYRLTLGRMSRVFQKSDVTQIVGKILGEHGVPSRFHLFSTYQPHEYCAEYREDDWTFISRMLEEEGLYYWFDHSGDSSVLVIDDSSESAPDLQGGAEITFAFESGVHASREIIEELGGRIEVTPTRFTVGSFNHERPLLKVNGGAGAGPLEVYDAPGGGPDTPDGCERRAKLLLQAAKAAGAGVSGLSSSVRLVPGMVASVVGHPLARFDRRYLITATHVAVTQRRRGAAAAASEGGRPYACRFEAIPQDVAYRPVPKSPPAKQAGLQSAIVIGAPGEEVFPDPTGRVRAQLRWDREGARDDKSGKWMRVAQRGTADSMLLPRVGWSVLTFNEEGEVDAPSILSRIHDAEHPPTYSLPANKTRVVWKTATTPGGGSHNEIYFEDKKGAEEMFINASKDMIVLAQQVKSESVTRDSLRVVGNNHDLTVGSNFSEHVTRNQTVSIGANEDIHITNNRLKEVRGDESAAIGGSRRITTSDQIIGSVKGTRNVTVGSSVIDRTTGGVATTAGGDLTITIGGSDLKQASGSVVEDVGKNSKQIIAGSKQETAAVDRFIDSRNKYIESIGGSLLLRSAGRFQDGAEKKARWTIAAALIARAPKVFLQAKDKIELRCGATVLTVLPDSVEITSPSFDLSDAKHIEVVTKKVTHN